MGRNMKHNTNNNVGSFSVVRGGQYAKQRAKSAAQEEVYRTVTERPRGTRKALRSLKDVLCGRTNPNGEVVKLIYRLRSAGVSETHVRAIAIEPLEREIERAFDLRPAA